MVKKEKLGIIIILLIAGFLRFYNLMHDSPYFFNPDERNMAGAITRFQLPSNLSEIPICLISQIRQISTDNRQLTTDNCNLNPHFFAYGQFPLYLSYLSDQITKPLINLFLKTPTTDLPAQAGNRPLTTDFPSAIFWLRFYSALTSTLTVVLVYLITRIITSNYHFKFSVLAPSPKRLWFSLRSHSRLVEAFGEARVGEGGRVGDSSQFSVLAALSVAFTPGLIQAAHFGTTESLLTFFFLASVYLSLKFLSLLSHLSLPAQAGNLRNSKGLSSIFYLLSSIFLLSLTIGLSLGSKFTGIFFLVPPFVSLMIRTIELFKLKKRKRRRKIIIGLLGYWVIGLLVVIGSIIFAVISSPYNLIEKQDFLGAVFGYEAEVATGKYEAFYTRQFINTTPILFQAEKIFPYALGWPIFILGSIGLLLTSLKLLSILILSIIFKVQISRRRQSGYGSAFVATLASSKPSAKHGSAKEAASATKFKVQIRKVKLYLDFKNLDLIWILIFGFWIYFIPNAFLFAKWTRFMVPIFPFFAIFAGYSIHQLYPKIKNWPRKLQITNYKLLGYCLPACLRRQAQAGVIGLLVFISVLPGAAFMSIYTREDVRVTASYWIYKNIPHNSYILFETGNVVDIPLGIPNYQPPITSYNLTTISFDFYHLDENSVLFTQLLNHLEKAAYIFIPSRRIFFNYPRFPEKFPLITKYYQLLFSGRLGFEKVAEISSYPMIVLSSLCFNDINHCSKKWNLTFPDENAEETFTVFDHPVIRIYKKVKPMTKTQYKNLFETK